MKPLVLYHASCSDGFAAAWCAWKRFGDEAEYRAVNYGDDPPDNDLHGRDVYILDFSYLPEVIDKMAEQAATITLLDHHKTALERFTEAWGGSRTHRSNNGTAHEWDWGTARVLVDLDRSGAQLAHDYFGAGPAARTNWTADPRELGGWPAVVIAYVADRDLWRWKLPDSREVNAYIRSLPQTFEAWDCVISVPEGYRSVAPLVEGGRAILQSQAREIERAVRRARRMDVVEHIAADVPRSVRALLDVIDIGPVPMIVNTTENMSEVLEVLAREPPHWAIGWYQAEDGTFRYSLRSTPDGPDVSTIARAFEGGGHRQAAGFSSNVLLF